MEHELIHYGVKGMRWGVRKARTGDLNKMATRFESVADGTGTKRDKRYVKSLSTRGGRRKLGGLEKASAEMARQSREEIKRLSTKGEATTADLIRAYGSVSLISIVRSRKD